MPSTPSSRSMHTVVLDCVCTFMPRFSTGLRYVFQLSQSSGFELRAGISVSPKQGCSQYEKAEYT